MSSVEAEAQAETPPAEEAPADASAEASVEASAETPPAEETAEEVEDVFIPSFMDTSLCPPTDRACRDAEEADRLAAEAEREAAMEGVYQPDNSSMAHTSSTGLVCTMDGFTKMIEELTEVLFSAIGVLKELALGMIPDNFKKALNFAWVGAVGMGNWIGYVIAAIYFISLEVDFGADTCEFFGYGYWLVDNMYVIVDFMPKGDDTGIDIMNLASQGAKDSAALDAMAAALASKNAVEEAQKDAVQANVDAGNGATDAPMEDDAAAAEAEPAVE